MTNVSVNSTPDHLPLPRQTAGEFFWKGEFPTPGRKESVKIQPPGQKNRPKTSPPGQLFSKNSAKIVLKCWYV